MDGIHDMGGMHGFGKVEPEQNELVFHAAWEGRTLALQRALMYVGAYNIDQMRAAIEALPPDLYLSSSYYKRWALEIENVVTALGLAAAEEINAGHARHAGKTLPRKLAAAEVANALTRGSYFRPPPGPARFQAGDRVRARNIHPATHTRLPRYVRGHVGVVEALRGCHVFPDTSALGQGDHQQWLYTVVFDGQELWGADADPTLTVSIEAFEPYLDAASS